MINVRDSALPVCLAFENVVSHAVTTLFCVLCSHHPSPHSLLPCGIAASQLPRSLAPRIGLTIG